MTRDDRPSPASQTALPAEAAAILDFWFKELTPQQWWRDKTLDSVIADRFGAIYTRLAEEVPREWLASPRAALAAVIALDQFPRNMFRGTARAFATDAKAREITRLALDRGLDAHLGVDERTFLYLPLEHSEDNADQERSVALFRALGQESYLDFAIQHAEVIAQFGRFPQRNTALGRPSTEEETAFLAETNKHW